jgi:hypothetical protein
VRTHELLVAIYRSGVGITLDLIASLGRAIDSAAHDEVVVRFGRELVKLGEPDDLAVATCRGNASRSFSSMDPSRGCDILTIRAPSGDSNSTTFALSATGTDGGRATPNGSGLLS